MTLPRSERDVHDVLYDLATSYQGGIESLAPRMGTTARKLYKRIGPGNPDREPTIRELSMIVEMSAGQKNERALEPLQALCFRHGGIFLPIEDFDSVSDDDILRGVSHVMAQMGSMAGAVNDALDEGEITDRQMERIEPRVRRSFAVMAALWARIKGRVKRDAIKPRRPFFAKSEDKVAL